MAWKTSHTTQADPLSGKRLGIIGSSSADITYGEKNYLEWIAERTGIVLVNQARAGSHLSALTSDYAAETGNQIKQAEDLPSNLDIVIVQPGANDDNNSRALGAFEDADATTFYGALHLLCDRLATRYATIPVGIVTPQYSGDQDAQTSPYHEATKEVCGHYGFPVVDLKREGQTPYWLASFKASYCVDNLHLNEAGNLILSRRVEAFLRQMTGK